MNLYLGVDFGTSGARLALIDQDRGVVVDGRFVFEVFQGSLLCNHWEKALFSLLEEIPQFLRRDIRAIAINGTSSTVLLCDELGNPISTPLMYNDDRGEAVLEQLKSIAPPNHTVLSATSSLAKLMWMYHHNENFKQSKYFLHQADWLGFLLHGRLGISDYHNALKLGYDVEKFNYPDWLLNLVSNLEYPIQLPKILAPGTPIGKLKPDIANRFGFNLNCLVCAGTTDSIAAFIASGASSPGEAVTSLGSTLVLKLLSRTRVDNSKYGIYSHRFGNLWLVGGASNCGGAILKHFFSEAELENLSQQINPNKESLLNYYPLQKKGERFPINDPNLQPCLEPRPDSNVDFLHGLLASMARIESQGYKLLQQLGSDSLARVYTAGGGAANQTWTTIRQNYLQVPVLSSPHTESAYGSALLTLGLK
jgi:D-ribulokinase